MCDYLFSLRLLRRFFLSLSASFLTKYMGIKAISAMIEEARKISNGGFAATGSRGLKEFIPMARVIMGPIIIGTITVKHILTPWKRPSVPFGM